VIAPADARLVAREAQLPGLATLLDADAFAHCLREHLPEREVGSAQPTYVRYKPGTSCVVAYRARIDGESRALYARAVAPDAEALGKLAKVRRHAATDSTLGRGGLLVDELAIAVYALPVDRRMPSLRRLLDRRGRPRLMQRALERRPWMWAAGLEPLRWKPERRFVARLDSVGTGALVKLYAPGEFERALPGSRAFKSGRTLRVPRELGSSRRHRLIVLEWLPGEPLDRRATGESFDPARCRAVGAALAELHAQEPRRGMLAPSDEPGQLLAAVRATAVAGEEVEAHARRLATRLLPELERRGRTVPIHGDFSVDQILLDDQLVRLLDFDAAAVGDSQCDLGSFAADLEVRALEGSIDRARMEAMVEKLIGGYERSGGETPRGRALESRTAAAMLRRAPEPFRRRRDRWDELVCAIVERAAELAPKRRRGSPAPRPRPPAGSHRGRSTAPEPRIASIEALDSIELEPGPRERLGLAPGPLILGRAWPSADCVLLEYRDPVGRILAGRCPGDGEATANGAGHRQGDRARTAVSVRAAASATVALYPYASDPGLPGLARAARAPGATVLGHRLDRRALVRVERPGETRFVKIVRPRRAHRVLDGALRAAALAGDSFSVPRPVDVDLDAGTVAFETLRGRPLAERLDETGALVAAGRAIRALHDAEVGDLAREHSEADEIDVLERWVARLVAHLPGLRTGAELGRERVATSLAALAGPRAAVHRDLHDGQLLVDDGDRIALLDCDTLALGDPALDLGNLLAHLELHALQRRRSAATAADAAEALLAGYRPDAGLLERVVVYGDAARLRLACVYAFRPRWRRLALPLLDLVGSPLAGTRGTADSQPPGMR
jgi:aminoglycoside phosphotransferase (APT) family kinase protein